MDLDTFTFELEIQGKAYGALETVLCGLHNRCKSILDGFSTSWRVAAGPRPQPADSDERKASVSTGRCDGSAANAGADSASKKGMPCKAKMPVPNIAGKGASQMPGKLSDQSRLGHPVSDTSAVAAATLMTEATAKTQAAQSPPAEGAAQHLIRQDSNARQRQNALLPHMHNTEQLNAGAKERLAQEDSSAQAEGREAAPDQQSEQSGPELAAQEAKQARKQAKRARQRARRAQGAPADADSKV